MFKNRFPHLGAVLQALFVTFLWSTSWVLIKIGLEDIPALTFAGLRYSLAFLCLLPLGLRPAHLRPLRGLSGRRWARLIVLGLLFYAVTQGAQFLGLAYLPAVTVSNRVGDIPPLTVTMVSMGVGAIMLLATGILTQGLPPLSPIHWAIIGWLAVVNTAFAFTLWNHTLRTLSAMESSIINSTMLVQIAILAWLFLGEHLTWQEVIGMVLAGLGTLIVQVRET